MLLCPGSIPVCPLCHSPPPFFSVSAAAAYLATAILMPAYSHHLIPTCASGALSNLSNRSISDRVPMYCATVFFRRQLYSSVVWNPTSSLAVTADVYFHFPSGFLRGSRPVSRLATCSWNPTRDPPMQAMTNQVFKRKINTPIHIQISLSGIFPYHVHP